MATSDHRGGAADLSICNVADAVRPPTSRDHTHVRSFEFFARYAQPSFPIAARTCVATC